MMQWLCTATTLLALSYPPVHAQPMVNSFTLDVNVGVIELIFSETVSLLENFLEGLTIQSSAEDAEYVYQFTGGTISDGTASVETAVITLSLLDLNAIKANQYLATSAGNTYLALAEGILVSHDSEMISAAAVLQVGTYLEDTTAPELQQFSLDLNTGQLHMTFTEPILWLLFNSTGVMLLSGPEQPVLRLPYEGRGSGSGLPPVAVEVYTYYFTSDDVLYLEEISPPLSVANTFISMATGTTYDTNSNPLVRVDDQAAFAVVISTGLELGSFTLDLNAGILSTTFTAGINPELFDITGFSLWSSRDESTGESIRLTYSGPGTSVSGSVLDVDLGFADLTAIKANPNIATSIQDTYLSVDQETVSDITGNANKPSSPIQVENYVPDSTQPVFESFDLDMNTQVLNITFNEPVDINTIDTTAIFLQNSLLGDVSYNLLQAAREVSQDNLTVVVFLTDNDISSLLELSDLATTRGNTFLSFTGSLVQDLSGNAVLELPVAIVSNFSPLSVLELSAFTLDLNTGTLSFTSSSPLVEGNVNSTYITLQNSASDSTAKYRLTGGVFVSKGETSSSITLLREDLVTLYQEGITTPNQTTNDLPPVFLSASKGFAQTNDGTHSTEIGINEAEPVDVIPDTTPPVLIMFTLDMNSEILVLTFSEVVNATALNQMLSGITIQSTANSGGESYTLAAGGGATQSNDASVLAVSLTENSLNILKRNSELATSAGDTFLSLAENTTFDVYGNGNVDTGFGVMVSMYIEDSQPPQLLSFDLDMNTGSMTLTFSEPVLRESLQLTSLALHSAPTVSSISFSLTAGGTVLPTTDGLIISLALAQLDVDSLGSIDLAESADTTYLSMDSSAVVDTAGNAVVPIAVGSAIAVARFTPITGPPELKCFSLDMNTGTLSLSFQKPVNFTQRLNLEGISLQSTNVTMGSTKVVMFSLISGTFEAISGTSIEVQLNDDTIDALKVETMLASSFLNTFITLEAGVVVDDEAQDSIAITSDAAMQVCDFNADETRPQILRWSLDLLQENTATIYFDEPVKVDSFLGDRFTIQARNSISGLGKLIRVPNHQLLHSAAQYDSIDSMRTLTLSLNMDKDALIKDPDFCKEPGNTYLSCRTNAVRDYNDNTMQILGYNGGAIQVETLLVDADPPSLTKFTLDLRGYGRKEMNLTFNELVRVNPNLVRFLTVKMSELDTNSKAYTLTSSVAVVESSALSHTVTIKLSDYDLDQLCALSASTTGCLYPLVYYDSGLVQDSVSNLVPARQSDRAFSTTGFGHCSMSDFSKCPSAAKPQPLGDEPSCSQDECISSSGMCCSTCCPQNDGTQECCSTAAGKAVKLSVVLFIVCIVSHFIL